jgi:hypothetical protein
MDPLSFVPATMSNPTMQPVSSYMFAPGIFFTPEDGDKFLLGLDSDTRSYVLNHTDEFRTIQDIHDCIDRLQKGS